MLVLAPCSGVSISRLSKFLTRALSQPLSAPGWSPHPGMERIGRHLRPVQAPRQLEGEQEIGKLRAPVCLDPLVMLLALEVLEIDLASLVRHGRHVHDAGRGGSPRAARRGAT